jgi:hypothetical protein
MSRLNLRPGFVYKLNGTLVEIVSNRRHTGAVGGRGKLPRGVDFRKVSYVKASGMSFVRTVIVRDDFTLPGYIFNLNADRYVPRKAETTTRKPLTNEQRAKRNAKARERHWRKTGVGDGTINWMKQTGWL